MTSESLVLQSRKISLRLIACKLREAEIAQDENRYRELLRVPHEVLVVTVQPMSDIRRDFVREVVIEAFEIAEQMDIPRVLSKAVHYRDLEYGNRSRKSQLRLQQRK